MATEGTATADRACTACATGSFSSTTNASACTAYTPCAAGTYVSTQGTGTTDQACTACATGSFSSTTNASACTLYTPCAAGTYVSTDGTATADQACTACATGTFSSSTNAASCTTYTPCAAGTYVSTDGTATTDRVCADCTSGTFTSTSNETSCADWRDCAPGDYIATDGTTSSDRVCDACPSGQYSSVSNSTSCNPIGTCAAGTRQTAPGTPTSPVQCAMCDVGTYCAGGTAAPVACTNETWDHDANPANECVAWSTCAIGFEVSSTGSAVTDRQCAPCPSNEYSDTTNAPSCTPWRDCNAGTSVTNTPSPTTDRVCTTCTTGSFSTTQNAPSCTQWTTCPSGTYEVTAGTTTSDRTCAAPTDCFALLVRNPGSTDGIYLVDPDGVSGVAAFDVYCDMTNGGWTQILDQDVTVTPGYQPVGSWLSGVTTTAPNGGQWSVLQHAGLFSNASGGYELRIQWNSDPSTFVEWSQDTSPLVAQGIVSELRALPTGQRSNCNAGGETPFNGLGPVPGLTPPAALTGDVAGCWWWAVGSGTEFSGGIPMYTRSDVTPAAAQIAQRTSLYVRELPASGTKVCSSDGEGHDVTLTCPAGQTIRAITFASYGVPSDCSPPGMPYYDSVCHASTSYATMRAACVGQTTCTVRADNAAFGDPCGGIYKRLTVQAFCD